MHDRVFASDQAKELVAGFGTLRALLIAGDHEALRDDATRFADRTRAAGVDVTLDLVVEMYHAFPITPDAFPEARAACAQIGAFVQRVGAQAEVPRRR